MTGEDFIIEHLQVGTKVTLIDTQSKQLRVQMYEAAK